MSQRISASKWASIQVVGLNGASITEQKESQSEVARYELAVGCQSNGDEDLLAINSTECKGDLRTRQQNS